MARGLARAAHVLQPLEHGFGNVTPYPMRRRGAVRPPIFGSCRLDRGRGSFLPSWPRAPHMQQVRLMRLPPVSRNAAVSKIASNHCRSVVHLKCRAIFGRGHTWRYSRALRFVGSCHRALP
jgi:hypothetical protein